jgi:hypothetical protein
MNLEIKKKWISALRSGEYKQGKGQLRLEDEYCCLGVLCDLAVKSGVDVKVSKNFLYMTYDGADLTLPEKVRKWAGLEDGDPWTEGHQLSAWNDDEGADFEKIAQLIEEHL